MDAAEGGRTRNIGPMNCGVGGFLQVVLVLHYTRLWMLRVGTRWHCHFSILSL